MKEKILTKVQSRVEILDMCIAEMKPSEKRLLNKFNHLQSLRRLISKVSEIYSHFINNQFQSCLFILSEIHFTLTEPNNI